MSPGSVGLQARFPLPSYAVPSRLVLLLPQEGQEDGGHLLGKSAHCHRVGRVRTLGVPRLGFSSPSPKPGLHRAELVSLRF